MSVRIANGGEVSNHAADVRGRVDEEVLQAREFGDRIDFFTRVALKAEMIEVRFHRILDHHQYKCRVFAGSYGRPQPNIMSSFSAPIAHDRQTADAGVEVNRPIY